MSACEGCGTDLPAQSYIGRPRKWCSERCRRHTVYSRPCLDCGKPTYNGSNPPPERCSACNNRLRLIWTPDAITEAIVWWVRTRGTIPTATEWRTNNPAGIPVTATVQEVFGTWNEAIEAAGFSSRLTGTYGRAGEDMALCREIRERYEAGESTNVLALGYGCSAPTITYRIIKAGGRMRTQSEAQRLRWAA